DRRRKTEWALRPGIRRSARAYRKGAPRLDEKAQPHGRASRGNEGVPQRPAARVASRRYRIAVRPSRARTRARAKAQTRANAETRLNYNADRGRQSIREIQAQYATARARPAVD